MTKADVQSLLIRADAMKIRARMIEPEDDDQVQLSCDRITRSIEMLERMIVNEYERLAALKKDKDTAEDRNARLIDSGYEAYAREEGHYDQGDY